MDADCRGVADLLKYQPGQDPDGNQKGMALKCGMREEESDSSSER